MAQLVGDCLTKKYLTFIEHLSSTQEEAGGRLQLHAADISNEDYCSVIINADDTDVFLLMLAHAQYINLPMYQRSSSKGKINILNISKIAQTLGDDSCQAIIRLHAYLGCDTVSAFAFRGKISGFKLIIKKKPYFIETF